MIGVQKPPAATSTRESADPQHRNDNACAVRLEGLTKQFGSLRAVHRVSLKIQRGETVALLGPNGSGKTTTVSLLLGLLRPESGIVSILGMSPAAAIQSGRIGVMLQEGSLMPGVCVAELLDYVL